MSAENQKQNNYSFQQSHAPGDQFHPSGGYTPSHEAFGVNSFPSSQNLVSSSTDSQSSQLQQSSANPHLPDQILLDRQRLESQLRGEQKAKKLRLIIGLIVMITAIILGVGFSAYNVFFVAPKQALANYVEKVATAKTANYEGNISFRKTEEKKDQAVSSSISTDLIFSDINVSVKGAYDLRDKDKPKIDFSIAAKSAGVEVARANIMGFYDELFLKIDSLGMLSGLGLKTQSQWYKLKVAKALESAGNKDCKLDADKDGLFGSPIFSGLPVQNTKRVAFSKQVAGRNTTHYYGEIDFSKIQNYIDGLNSKLPASCKITFKKSDFGGLDMKYNLYTSKDYDRLDLTIISNRDRITTEITIDTKDYNKPISIEKPANAKEITDIMEIFGYSPVTPARGRDSQRKSDLRNIKTALESYYNDNSSYPAAASWETDLQGGPPYMKDVPEDPKTQADYTYTPAPAGGPYTSYTLQTTLENTSDKEAGAGGVYQVTSAQKSLY